MKLKIAAVILLLAVGAGAVGYAVLGIGSGTPATSQYLTARVSRQDVVDQVVATGSVSATSTYSLSFGSAPQMQSGGSSASASSSSSNSSGASAGSGSSVTWSVATVTVAVGDHVKKDQVLATATSADLDGQILGAQRTVASAGLQLAMANSTLASGGTTAQVRQAYIAVYQAQTQVANADSQLAALNAEKAWSSLNALADGVITSVAIAAGDGAPSGVAIGMQSATLAVVGNVVESDLTSVVLGQPATVTITAVGADVQGTVGAIAPVATASSGGGGSSVVTFAVTVNLASPPDTVHAGMSARVSIDVAQAANVLAVPTAAISGSAGAYQVRVLGADGQVQAVAVTVGLITSSLAEIKSGLSAGETVITGTSTQRATTGLGLGGGLGGGFRAGGPGG